MTTITLEAQQINDLAYAVDHLIARYYEQKPEHRTPYGSIDEVVRMKALADLLQAMRNK